MVYLCCCTIDLDWRDWSVVSVGHIGTGEVVPPTAFKPMEARGRSEIKTNLLNVQLIVKQFGEVKLANMTSLSNISAWSGKDFHWLFKALVSKIVDFRVLLQTRRLPMLSDGGQQSKSAGVWRVGKPKSDAQLQKPSVFLGLINKKDVNSNKNWT